jgi:hypothetical protein
MGQSLAERLTSQFYAWESRGRGWQVWGEPVLLEPPFRPFARFVHFGEVSDDARSPSLLERLGSLLRRPEGSRACRPPGCSHTERKWTTG